MMQDRPLRLGAVVLAAGAGSRYSNESGAKLLVSFRGRPLLAGVLATVREFGPAATVVVLGHGAEAIEQGIEWADERRILNHDPDRGLASSLQTGLEALKAVGDDFDGAFVVLGDQPLLRANVMRSLADAAASARPADRGLVVPRYERDEGPRNPVLILRPAWVLVNSLRGDRGLGPLIDERPDMVLHVPVAGVMPDVDSAADLDRIAGS